MHINTSFRNLTLLICCITSAIQAQDFPDNPSMVQVVPPSPTMREFEKYGSYPVSKFTGVPNISIPLFSIGEGDLNVPVTLSYHASGIRVNQKASWVGLGWSLLAGGAVTRTIRGADDDDANGYMNIAFRETGSIDLGTEYNLVEQIMQGYVDTESDIFNFNFLGYSGRFLWSIDKNKFIPVPHTDYKIEHTTDGLGDITQFTIITPDGVKAVFAQPEMVNDERPPVGFLGFTTIIANSTWHIISLTAANEVDQIEFEYKTTSASTHEQFATQSDYLNYNDVCLSTNYTLSYKESSGNSSTVYSNVKRLSKIIFDSGYLEFLSTDNDREDDPSGEDLRLNQIYLRNNDNDLIKGFEFNYDYFYSDDATSTDSKDYRLKLNKLTEIGSNSSQKEPHVFSYLEGVTYTRLPARLSNAQDYWGYYNGTGQNGGNMIPAYPYVDPFFGSTINLGDANRDVNSSYVAAGMINKITYPTKGYTIFSFESNSLSDGTLVGGTRVQNISAYNDNDALSWEKTYEYNLGMHNKQALPTPVSFFSSRREYHYTGTAACTGPLSDFVTYSLGMTSYVKNGTATGAVTYGEVTEYNGSVENHEGYTVSTFDGAQDGWHTGGIYTQITIDTDKSWSRGQLKTEKVYENGNPNPIKSTTHSYETVDLQDNIRGFKAGTNFDTQYLGYVPYADGSPTESVKSSYRNWQYFLMYYDEPVMWKRKKSTTTVADGITTTITYDYEPNNEHTGVLETNATSSLNEAIKTTLKYAYEKGEVTLLNQNRIGIPLETKNFVGANSTGGDRTTYKSFGASYIPYLHEQILSNGATAEQGEILEYVNGRVTSTRSKEGIVTSYLWGYNSQYPIVKVDNAANGKTIQYADQPTSPDFSQDVGDGDIIHSGAIELQEMQTITLDYTIVNPIPDPGNAESYYTKFSINNNLGNYFESDPIYLSKSQSNTSGSVQFVNVPPGEFDLIIDKDDDPDYIASVTVTYIEEIELAIRESEIFHTSFEDHPSKIAGVAQTGDYYIVGLYDLALEGISAGDYILSYWQDSGSGWALTETQIEVTGGSTTLPIGGAGIKLDEVRLYPVDAQMATYTYDPLIGMTSQTDPNNVTVYYEYDDFGRLKHVKDQDRNVLSKNEYHYRGE